MKVLLRDDKTGRYYSEGDQWVASSADARPFGTLEAAGLKAQECKASSVSVVLSYEEPPCELALNPAYCTQRMASGAAHPK